MSKIISFSTAKGGVGKTTLASATAGICKNKGLKVLYIDADPQGSFTHELMNYPYGYYYDKPNFHLTNILKDEEVDIVRTNIILYKENENFQKFQKGKKNIQTEGEIDFIPAQLTLFDNLVKMKVPVEEGSLTEEEANEWEYNKKEELFYNFFRDVSEDYDITIIDAPPNIGLIQRAIVRAADRLIIPMVPRNMDVGGMKISLDQVEFIFNNLREGQVCNIEKIIIQPNMFIKKEKEANEILNMLNENFMKESYRSYQNCFDTGLEFFPPISQKAKINKSITKRLFLVDYLALEDSSNADSAELIEFIENLTEKYIN